MANGLTSITTSHMARRSIQLGGKHISYLFVIPFTKIKITPQRKAETAIYRIMKKPVLMNFLKKLDIIFIDEFAQVSSELQGILDIILRRIKKSNTYRQQLTNGIARQFRSKFL